MYFDIYLSSKSCDDKYKELVKLLVNLIYIEYNTFQGLLEHNVRLQVEVEELRRQLTDKQELLAAAAEAIDVLEQQVCLTEVAQNTPNVNNMIIVRTMGHFISIRTSKFSY